MKLDPNDEKTITEVGLRIGSTILVNDVKNLQYEGCGGGNIGLLKSKKPCTKIYNGELKGLSKLCYLKEISSKLKLEQLDKLPEKINLIIRILKKSQDINSKFINNNDINENIKNEIKEMLNKINELTL